ncbi:MAG: hypothetical protein HYY65_10325 [Candidatus Tectomicrobia bacterium]|uniref:Cytochrome b/b6 C-terminal region profile domain-containing protein n=1 Tax=Tectimicrobiota bacterium TaxID=2528274 RepID=A0A932GR62_UNCTE|nr:hypothetical protein [Candidatus Tectomicrobia bacterium]
METGERSGAEGQSKEAALAVRAPLPSFPGRPSEEKESSLEPQRVPTFPNLVYIELIAALAVTALLIFLSLGFDAPLQEMADPNLTPNPSKAPWYFVGFQELLVYFDPWIGGFLIPLMIIVGLILFPYLDPTRKEGEGYRFRDRPLAVTIFTAGLTLWFVLIALGSWFRGPNWQFYWPWESWNIEKPLPKQTTTLPAAIGISILIGYLAAGFTLPAIFLKGLLRRLGIVRYLLFAGILSMMGGVFLKIGLRLLFNVKYVLQTRWFNL